jgi:hypothetical protein
MRHPSEAEIRATLDGEAAPDTMRRVLAHLENCPFCQSTVSRINRRSSQMQTWMGTLDPGPSLPVSTARMHFEARLANQYKEKNTMWKRFTSSRPAWAALAIILVLGVSMAFPQVRALAGDFLGIFRVQQIAAVPVNPANLPTDMNSVGTSIENLLSQDFTYKTNGQEQSASDASQASALAGFQVRLPSQASGSPKISVQPSMSGTFTVDLPRIQAILQEMGRSDIQLPTNLDKAVISVEVPSSVTSAYGTCTKVQPSNNPDVRSGKGLPPVYDGQGCTVLVQLPSPTVNAPAGLDVNQLGQQFLEILGVPTDQAQKFSQEINWSTTLVVPIPITGASYQDIQVDGASGLLVTTNRGNGTAHYVILWVKNGIVYALEGAGDSNAGVTMANSLQ